MKMLTSFPEATFRDLLDWGKKELEFLGFSEAQVNAEQWLCEITGLGRSQLYLETNRKISRDLKAKFQEFVGQRKKRIPLAYLRGKAFFWEEELKVSPDCLIPRSETELLIEQFIGHTGLQKTQSFSFLDLGAGSGAIGIALLRHFPESKATFSDISPEALRIVKSNLNHYDLLNRAEMICSDLFINLQGRKWNAILSNPPYLSEEDWEVAQPEILFEPKLALAGGKDGLDFYRRIILEAKHYLEEKGWLVMEMGKGQSEIIKGWFREKGFKKIEIFKDLNGIDRVIMGQI